MNEKTYEYFCLNCGNIWQDQIPTDQVHNVICPCCYMRRVVSENNRQWKPFRTWMDEKYYRVTELEARVAELEAQVKAWKSCMEGLTPSGSEYVNDPERCAEYIRQRTQYPKMIIALRERVTELEAELTEMTQRHHRAIMSHCDSH